MKKRVAMLPVFFVGGGEGGGDAITAQKKKSRAGGEDCGESQTDDYPGLMPREGW